MGMGGQRYAPAVLLPERDPVPIIQVLDGPQGRSGLVRKISLPTEIRSWTVRPVASRYTD